MADAPAGLVSASSLRDPYALIVVAEEKWSPRRTVCHSAGGSDLGALTHGCPDCYGDRASITKETIGWRRGSEPDNGRLPLGARSGRRLGHRQCGRAHHGLNHVGTKFSRSYLQIARGHPRAGVTPSGSRGRRG